MQMKSGYFDFKAIFKHTYEMCAIKLFFRCEIFGFIINIIILQVLPFLRDSKVSNNQCNSSSRGKNNCLIQMEQMATQ